MTHLKISSFLKLFLCALLIASYSSVLQAPAHAYVDCKWNDGKGYTYSFKSASNGNQVVCYNGAIQVEVTNLIVSPATFTAGPVANPSGRSFADGIKVAVSYDISVKNSIPQFENRASVADFQLTLRPVGTFSPEEEQSRIRSCMYSQESQNPTPSVSSDLTKLYKFAAIVGISDKCPPGKYAFSTSFRIGNQEIVYTNLSSLPGRNVEILEGQPKEKVRCFKKGLTATVDRKKLICDYVTPEPVLPDLRWSGEVMVWQLQAGHSPSSVSYSGQKVGAKCQSKERGMVVSTRTDQLKCTKISRGIFQWKSTLPSASSYVLKACTALRRASASPHVLNFNHLGTMLTNLSVAARFDSTYIDLYEAGQRVYDAVVKNLYTRQSDIQTATMRLNAVCGTSIRIVSN